MHIEHHALKVAGDFEVSKKLATSAFSCVYIAKETSSGKSFALKAIKHPNNKHRVNHEIHVMKTIKNVPNILRLYKVFKDNKKLFFVYELANGGDLYDYVQNKDPLEEDEIITILHDLLNTLKRVHEKDIIHMDIKPENILIHNGKYCLCDWGLSKQSNTIKMISAKENNLYSAPEIFEGYSYKASDIYSLGLTLYYLATKQRGFDFTHDDDFSYIMYAHCNLSLDYSLISSPKIRYLIERMTNKHYLQRASIQEIESIIQEQHFTGMDHVCSVNYALYKNKSNYELYEELSLNNIPFAQNNLGLLYENQGDLTNLSKASVLYEKAAQKEFTRSYFHLALCYQEGKGLPKDLQKAFEFFKKAAIKNHDSSIYYLAQFYEKGIVVQKDLKKAIQLYFESASYGNMKAYEKLNTFQ
jgi:serine/threonine protein kinase